jgi:repressor LexA
MEPALNTHIPCPENVSPLRLCRYPILGEIACGSPILAVEDPDAGYVTAAETNADFCLTAKGDSMIGARIFDGDEVFIQQTDLVENGEIAAVVVDGEATLKRVYYYPEEEKLILSPENPAYEPLVFVGRELADIRILGRAVAFQAKLR